MEWLTLESKVRVFIGFGTEGSEAVEMRSKGWKCLVRSTPPAVSAGTGVALWMNVVLFLEIMEDWGIKEKDEGRVTDTVLEECRCILQREEEEDAAECKWIYNHMYYTKYY